MMAGKWMVDGSKWSVGRLIMVMVHDADSSWKMMEIHVQPANFGITVYTCYWLNSDGSEFNT